jgi:hypothetical protein
MYILSKRESFKYSGNSCYGTPNAHHRHNKSLSMDPSKKDFNSVHTPQTINKTNTLLSMLVPSSHIILLVISFHKRFQQKYRVPQQSRLYIRPPLFNKQLNTTKLEFLGINFAPSLFFCLHVYTFLHNYVLRSEHPKTFTFSASAFRQAFLLPSNRISVFSSP